MDYAIDRVLGYLGAIGKAEGKAAMFRADGVDRSARDRHRLHAQYRKGPGAIHGGVPRERLPTRHDRHDARRADHGDSGGAFGVDSIPVGLGSRPGRRALLAAALMHGLAAGALASEGEDVRTEVQHEELHHRHHVAVFLGGAVRDEEETESGFAGGIDYEYRIHRLVGVGAEVEVATGGLRDVVVVLPIALYPWRGLRLVAAPGAEIPNEGGAEFALRLGVGYRFPIGRFTIGPEFDADIIDGTATYVFGVSFGVGF